MITRVRAEGALATNISWVFVANLVYAGAQWGMLVVLTRLGSAQTVGQFALGLVISAPALALAGLDLRSFQATDTSQLYSFGDYLGLRLLTTALAVGAVAAVAVLGGYEPEAGQAIVAVALAKAVEALSDIVYGKLQQHERLDRVATSVLARGCLGLAALSAGLAVTGSLVWACAAWATTWACVLIGYDLPHAARLVDGPQGWRPRWRRRALWGLARQSAPLGISALLITLYASIPRAAIERSMGAEALGIFAAIAYLERVGTTLVGAMGVSASARIARAHAEGDRASFRRLSRGLVIAGVVLGVAGVVAALAAGRPLLSLIYPAEYVRPDLLALTMAAAGLWYVASLLGYVATAARRIARQPAVLLVALGVSAGACWLLVPAHGLAGAALAMVAAAAVTAALYALLVGDLLLSP